VVARGANGQPRTYRLSPRPAQQAAYRRLASAMLGLDVATLADELRAERVARLGGTALVEPFDVPYSRMAVVRDPQGAVFSISKFVPPS
jgi:hypothetical protein